GTPFIIAVNCFDNAPQFQSEDIRIALTLNPEVPIVMCDARNRDSVKKVLVSLVRYVMNSKSKPSRAMS
ncbi:MAG: ATP-binding protein, partial [Trebonia sp.]